MATHVHEPQSKRGEGHPLDRFIISRSRLIFALILIALGGVFFLGQAGILDYGSSWWVIFIAIPGLVSLGSAAFTLLDAGKLTSSVVIQAVIGGVLLALSAILIWDPTWSFTRGWRLDRTFPFLRDLGALWPWILVVLGAGLVLAAFRQRSWAVGGLGGLLCLVGGVFLLNISWNIVWPLMLAALGVWLLCFKIGPQT